MDRKVCFKCEEEKDLDEFYPHPKMKDGHVNKCKECNKTDNTKHRDKNLDKIRPYDRDRSTLPHRKALNAKISERFCRENPEKRKAHNAVNNAVRDGRLFKPDNCERCNSDGLLHGHHHDYSKPLEVEWICVPCHGTEKK